MNETISQPTNSINSSVENVFNDFSFEKGLILLYHKRFGTKIFDSKTNQWGTNKSEFHTIVNGMKDICIFIEDEQNNVFGFYIPDEIQIGKLIQSTSCSLFTIKKNGVYELNKYERNNQEGYSYCIYDSNHHILFGIGMDNKGNWNDLEIQKKERNIGKSHLKCFGTEFEKETYPLTGKEYFKIVRIHVHQLIEDEIVDKKIEQMKQREQEEIKRKEIIEQRAINEIEQMIYKMIDDDKKKRMEMKQKVVKKDLEHKVEAFIQLPIFNVLFDSAKETTSSNTIKERLQGKGFLCFVCVTTRNDIFGGFTFDKLYYFRQTFDKRTQLFVLQREGKKVNWAIPLKKCYTLACQIPRKKRSEIIQFGGLIDPDGSRYKYDLEISKDNYGEYWAYTTQRSFEYQSIDNALMGQRSDKLSRFVIYEIEPTEQMEVFEMEKEMKFQLESQKLWDNQMGYIIGSLHRLCGNGVKGILFDSEKDKFSCEQPEFTNKLNNQYNFCVVVEDIDHNVFGGYIGIQIEYGKRYTTSKCFIFSLIKNGKCEVKKFDKQKENIICSFQLHKPQGDRLISFGETSDCRDLSIWKYPAMRGLSYPGAFERKSNENLTSFIFGVKRIMVFKMEDQ